MKPRIPNAVVLASGGLDSTVALTLAQRDYEIRIVLFFDYGQRALESERASVLALANYFGLPFREVDITWLEDLAPKGMRVSVGDSESGPLNSVDDVWIPNRNGVFLNVAAGFAERYGCSAVVTGFNREEAAEFPDNSRAYVDRVNEALSYSTRGAVRVESPTIDLSKREIILKGIEARAPLSVIWSCYRSGPRMCGDCASCRRLRAALDAVPAEQRPVIEFES